MMMMGGRCGCLQVEGKSWGVGEGSEDLRCENVPEECVLVPNQR